MRVVARAIEMIVWFESDGTPHPIRFRLKREDDEWCTINVEKIVTVEKEKLAGNHMYVFRCQSEISGLKRTYELKYEIATCKWILFKV
ncbi:hypothetical protein [Anaeromicrobium sediminis]|uniref:Uncharacterized protein n=1 Tax=Anaeromicrobium sediminis TaxID=1478221 RepID=A0A267MNF9_9FIRM|nr:hypothetical protein [Anaeromicrobium sediminis]PAB61151.1 hypothetical protein CCE28_01630 [Anaeromicrobium sediminis]